MNLDSIETRLQSLERQNRRLKRGGAVAFLLLAIVASMGAAHQWCSACTAQEFNLVDASGNSRAKLHIRNGEPELTFFRSGTTRTQVRLGISAGHQHAGELVLSDQAGTSLVYAKGNPDFALLRVLSGGNETEIRVP